MAVLSLLKRPLRPLFNGMEKWIRSIAKGVPDETDWKDSTKGSWYAKKKRFLTHGLQIN